MLQIATPLHGRCNRRQLTTYNTLLVFIKCELHECVRLEIINHYIIYCALCPGVIDWHNCGIVLGVLESDLGIGLDKCLHSMTLLVGMGPL